MKYRKKPKLTENQMITLRKIHNFGRVPDKYNQFLKTLTNCCLVYRNAEGRFVLTASGLNLLTDSESKGD